MRADPSDWLAASRGDRNDPRTGRLGSSRMGRGGGPGRGVGRLWGQPSEGTRSMSAPPRTETSGSAARRGSVVAQERRARRAPRRGSRTRRRERAPTESGPRSPRGGGAAWPPKPVAITVTRTSSPIDSSITAPKMTFAFGSACARDDLGRLVDLEEADVGAAGDVEQDAGGALDRRLEQRRGDRAAGRLGRAVLAGGRADAHQGRAGVAHDRAHVGEVEVDEARAP